MAERTHMGEFWDARAREDAFFFVDNRLEYRNPDVEAFWAEGRTDLDGLLGSLAVAPAEGETVVEIGCGLGRLTRALVARGARVIAVDVSAEMLAQARELNAHLDGVTWVHGDGASLAGVADASADAVVSHVVFQHIPDPQITLGYVREMGRVLRPGGWAAFQISNDASIHEPRGLSLRERAKVALKRRPQGSEDPAWRGSAVELDELKEACAQAELTVERVTGEGTQYCCVGLRR